MHPSYNPFQPNLEKICFHFVVNAYSVGQCLLTIIIIVTVTSLPCPTHT